MKQEIFEIKTNERLTHSVWRAVLEGDVSAITAPGQFVNVKLEGSFLRRPISVCDKKEGELTLVYKTVGEGTALLSRMGAGSKLNILCGLGNGYDSEISGDRPLLAGGGVGLPPLYWLCKTLCAQGKSPTVIMGFNTASEIFLYEEFENTGARVLITTADGSAGMRGFTSDAMAGLDYTCVYACGPYAMLRAVEAAAQPYIPGQFSFEERMGCGFGACMGCTVVTKNGPKRLCKEGPVLMREEIIWQTRG